VSASRPILITGGAGYIGSHLVLKLLEQSPRPQRVVVVDNLDRGHRGAIDAIAAAAPHAAGCLAFHHLDIRDTAALAKIIAAEQIGEVVHLAALAYVGESVFRPLDYWRVNVEGSLSLLAAMDEARRGDVGVSALVFSSTCATYGVHDTSIVETSTQQPINPYGHSKLAVERALADYAAQRVRLDEQAGRMPFSYACLAGRRPEQRNTLTIMGSDYATPDGTAVRDYVHVDDLVDAHIRVLHALRSGPGAEARAYNVGTGGSATMSIMQLIDACQRVTGRKLSWTAGPRREGDPPVLTASVEKIRRELGWTAKYTDVDTMIAHAWAWMQANPRGYGS
jgi:UDP-glucose 4-epimerase